jgi:hypothetical protein
LSLVAHRAGGDVPQYRAKFSSTDAQLAQGLGVSTTTAAKYREQLQALGLLRAQVEKVGKGVEIRIKSAKY